MQVRVTSGRGHLTLNRPEQCKGAEFIDFGSWVPFPEVNDARTLEDMYLKVFCWEDQASISGFSGVSSLPPKYSHPLKKQASHLKTYIDLATLSQASFSQG